MELAVLLLQSVGDLVRNERRRREDELERLDLLQLGLQGLERVDGKTRCGDLELAPRRNRPLQVVAEQLIDVVNDLHLLDFDDEAERRNSGGYDINFSSYGLEARVKLSTLDSLIALKRFASCLGIGMIPLTYLVR